MPDGSQSAVPNENRLTLVTLGASALRAEPAVTLFDIGKPLAVITYLCCAPERSVAREHLIDLLWGDVEPDAGKHALRQTLWYIRKRLGEHTLISGGDVLTVVGAVTCDRDAFLAAVAENDVEAVVRRYTGDFFPGFAAPGGAEFERWADIERQRLRSFFWRSAEVVVRRWMSSGRLREAQALARRVRDSDVLREGGWRLLFETMIAAGDAVGGPLEAAAFDKHISAEGITPEPATRALLREVRQARTDASARDSNREPPSLAAELVGREQEFGELLRSWEAARAGKSTHVHVLAPAGLGKTRLLTDVHARLRATRARTLFVRASFGARDIPFGLAGDLAEALARLPGASGISTGSARALVSLNPALSASYSVAVPDTAGDPADTLRRRALAIRELISAVAEEQPVAIFVDDVQWADVRSRQLIASVFGALERARVLAVTASRPTVDALASAEQALTIRLAPLTPAAVGALVASIAELPSEPWAEQVPVELCNATGGSPLLVLETLQLAMEGGTLERGPAGWRAPRPSQLFAALGAGGALRQRVERLDRVEQWVMTLLAVAAIPLTRDAIMAAAGRSVDEVGDALGSLERRGLVSRHEELWTPSHDEIAAMAVELATPDARKAAARSVGRVILERRSDDPRELRQAGALLARAEDHETLAAAFRRFAYIARGAGDVQPNRALAGDFLGEQGTPGVISRLVRSLPLVHRVGLFSGRRQATIAAMVALVPLGYLVNASIERRPPPDIELAIGSVGDDSVARVYRIPIRGAELAVGATIKVAAKGRPAWTFHADPSMGAIVRNPMGKSWLLDRVSPDSGGIDLTEISDDGTERRVTYAVGDDYAVSWSPDGRYIAYLTARWNKESRYDIAIQDMRTGAVRQLTSGDEQDRVPVWSPDGGSIVFERMYLDGRRRAACIVALDGSHLRCFGGRTGDYAIVGGWYDPAHILVVESGANAQLLARLDVGSGAIDTIAVVSPGAIRISPDGRWVLCECRRVGFAQGAVLLFPVDEPNRVVEVDVSAIGRGHYLLAGWVGGRNINRWADSLTIDNGPGTPVAGIPHVLKASGIAVDKTVVPIGPVRWRSLDTTVATIDEHGVMFPKRAGLARIEAALAGWRSTSQTLAVRVPESTVIFREGWKSIGPEWVSFGDPRPRIDSSADNTPAFLNNGDGSFISGAYTRREFPTSGGLRLDGWISALITRNHWQILAIALDGGLDNAGLPRWSHRYGNLPRRGYTWPTCTAQFPTGPEDITFGDSIGGVAGQAPAHILRAPPSFRRGAWIAVALQVFPDGRCGVAINGAPVTVSPSRVITDSVVRVLLFGNSAGSKVLAGPLTLRSGVPADIDWSRVAATVPNAPPPGKSPRTPE